MWGSGVTQERLIENTTLLQCLSEVPALPTTNELPTGVDDGRKLSITREDEICSNLAFILASKDDSERVMAVCVEESLSGKAVIVRVASNSGELQQLKKKLMPIARTLEKAALRESPKLEDQRKLVNEIVLLDEYRILSRLRSKHAEKTFKSVRKTAAGEETPKKGLIPRLNSAVHQHDIRPTPIMSVEGIESLRRMAKDLQTSFNTLEAISDSNTQSMTLRLTLASIIEQAYHLSCVVGLETVLKSCQMLDPSQIKYLPQALGKLGRYYRVGQELICAARDKGCRIFERVIVEAFEIQVPPTNSTVFHDAAIPSVQHVASDMLQPMVRKAKLGELSRKRLADAKQSFRRRILHSEGQRKVHAEIQLLFFYELHTELRPPRIICASKSACFLCKLFIQIHGKFHVSQAHGRIYSKWLLPDWLEGIKPQNIAMLRASVIEFNRAIEAKIWTVLQQNLKSYQHPNESVLQGPAYWSSSSTEVSRSIPEVSPAPATQVAVPSSSSTLRQVQNGSMSTCSTVTKPPVILDGAAKESITKLGSPARDSKISLPSAPGVIPPGMNIDTNIREVPVASKNNVYETGSPPNIQPYDQAQTQSPNRTTRFPYLFQGQNYLSSPNRTFRVRTKRMDIVLPCTEDGKQIIQIQWLNSEESLPMSDKSSKFIRVDDLVEGNDLTLGGVDILYLQHMEDVVSISLVDSGKRVGI